MTFVDRGAVTYLDADVSEVAIVSHERASGDARGGTYLMGSEVGQDVLIVRDVNHVAAIARHEQRPLHIYSVYKFN